MKSKHAAKDLQSFKSYQTLSIVYIKLSTIGGDTLNNSIIYTLIYKLYIKLYILFLSIPMPIPKKEKQENQEKQETGVTGETIYVDEEENIL